MNRQRIQLAVATTPQAVRLLLGPRTAIEMDPAQAIDLAWQCWRAAKRVSDELAKRRVNRNLSRSTQ